MYNQMMEVEQDTLLMKKKKEVDEPTRKASTMNLAQQWALSQNETMGREQKVVDTKPKVLKAYQLPLDLKSKDRVSQRKLKRKAFKAVILGNDPTKINDNSTPAGF